MTDEKAERKWVVELEPGVWMATWRGDPGRTTCLKSAKRYKSEHAAWCAYFYAKRFGSFENVEIYDVIFDPQQED